MAIRWTGYAGRSFVSNTHRKFGRAAVLLLTAVLFSATGFAQYRASLRGTVTDQAGAVVPDATVTLTNTDTNATLVAKSDANGIYQFNALPPAHFRITAEHPGFKKKLLEAYARGMEHRPETTFGTLNADVLDRWDPNFRRLNFCGLVLGSDWQT